MSKTLSALSLSLLGFFNLSEALFSEETPERWAKQGRQVILDSLALRPIETEAKNVILIVGDGMGISTVTASRIYEGQRRGETGEENLLSFETLPYSALSKTYNTNLQTPDSAGTMTAMVTGVKTRAGMLSVNQYPDRGDDSGVEGSELLTLLEKAELAGKWTGLVTTAKVTHATPAACYAHTTERNWECDADLPEGAQIEDIASQLLSMPQRWTRKGYAQVDGPEIVFGGGRENFFPVGAVPLGFSSEGDSGKRLDGRNLVEEWLGSRKRSRYIHDLDTFMDLKVDGKPKILGLFESSHMRFEADRKDEPSLAEMASKAVEFLSQSEEGYFLMVEAGRIDHAHHAGNAYRALADTVALSDAVRAIMEMTDREETLIVVTADHGHVFTMAGYPARGNDILGLVADANGTVATDLMGKPYTTLGYQNGPGYLGESDQQPAGPKTFPHYPGKVKKQAKTRWDLQKILNRNDAMDCDSYCSHLQESAYPLESETHGGEDVAIWADGPYAHLLRGTVEQNVIFHLMDHAFGWVDTDFLDQGSHR